MYVDDGAIFACGREWGDVEEAMQSGYATCAKWLTRAGLNIEPDKTELIFFRKRREGEEPNPHIHLPLPTYFSQKLSHFQFPRRCTNGRTGGTTRWPAELMYI